MSSSDTSTAAAAPGAHEKVAERALLSAIDASTRGPVFLFFVTAVLWLLGGTVFALVASIKLHNPPFLAQQEWLSFGVIRTAHLNSMIFGWATNAAFAVSIWLMARLSRTELQHLGVLYVAGALWNAGVAIGIFGILRGDSTSVEWLEIPPYATPILFVAYALVGAWAIVNFRYRQRGHVYVTQWYILAALFWFPWIYSAAEIMLIFAPARGTVQSLVNWWFAHNVLGLWFTPIGVGAIYYFIPKVLGKPIHSYYLSVLGFWSLAIFYNWAGVHHLIGGPVPAWVISVGVVASLLMVIPVVVIGINHHMTMLGGFSQLRYSPTLRFMFFGGVNYTLVSLLGSGMAVRSFNEIVHFTHFTVAHAHHGLYSFFTMVMFGAMYYIMPRLTLREWPSAKLISVHFWFTAVGVTLYVVGLSIGGIVQGWEMIATTKAANGEVALKVPLFLDVVRNTVPYLVSRSLSGMLIAVGHVAFAVNFGWMLLRPRAIGATAPTLFHTPPAMPLEHRA